MTSRLEEIGGAVTTSTARTDGTGASSASRRRTSRVGFAEFLTTVNGQPVIAQQEVRFTQTNSAVSGVLQYPLNRAHRVEVSGGVRTHRLHQ